MDRRKIAKALFDSRLMRNSREVKAFERARLAIFSSKDPSLLTTVFSALDDATEQHEVMWGLVHDAEAYDRSRYLREMAIAIPKMLPHAKEWALILLQRVLNSPDSVPIFREVISSLPADSMKIIERLLREIGKSTPKLGVRVRKLLE